MQEINVTKILLLGKTGVGKSTFANFILKYDRDVFQKSSSGNSCTREIQSMIGNKNTIASDLLIIDSPGMYDSEKTNEEIIKKIVSQLKENFADGLNCILLFFDGNAPRVDENVEKMIQLYLKIFPIKNFWSHVSLVFTKVYEYFPQQIYRKKREQMDLCLFLWKK
jgi:GTPase Era involved in 16S rRNA processing